ncbi:MAG: putative Ig domain-containing protein [Planctomycetota bacterium]
MSSSSIVRAFGLVVFLLSISSCVTATAEIVWYFDADHDGFGDPFTTTSTSALTSPGGGFVALTFDCNDVDPDLHPNSLSEGVIQDGIDNDCDLAVDEVNIYQASLPSPGMQSATVGETFVYTANVTTDSPGLSWNTILPAGMTFSSSGNSGTFTWVPGVSDVGLHRFSFHVHDSGGQSNSIVDFGIVTVSIPEPCHASFLLVFLAWRGRRHKS